MQHFLCSTCVGEYQRKCGYFESRSRRESVGPIRVFTQHQEGEIYCCNCGQASYLNGTYEQDSQCDGVHEEVERDEA